MERGLGGEVGPRPSPAPSAPLPCPQDPSCTITSDPPSSPSSPSPPSSSPPAATTTSPSAFAAPATSPATPSTSPPSTDSTIGSSFQVEVRQGPPSAVIEVDDNLLDRIVATNRDGLLRLALESGASIRGATLRATVTMPALTSVQASGASRVDFIDAIPTPDNLAIDLSGASRIDGMFSATGVTVRLSGASTIVGVLAARTAEIHVSGAQHRRPHRRR